MGDHNAGAACGDAGGGLLDLGLGHGIHRGGGFVQNEDPGICQHCPCKGDQLLFTGRQQVAAFAYIRIQTLLQVGDHILGRHRPDGILDLLLGGVGIAHQQVLPDGAGEQMGRLQHAANSAVEPKLGTFPGIPSVNEQRALGGLVEAAHQVRQGGFACAGLTYDGQVGAEGDLQREVFQHRFLTVGIAEGHILKFDVTL